MMKLSLMLEFFNTVDDKWQSDFANEILQPWVHDEGSLRVFRASANFVCQFTKDKKLFYIRFNHEEERNINFIEEEIKLLNILNSQGISVALPVLSSNNRFVETVNTELGVFHAVVFEGIKGLVYDIEEIRSKDIYLWGKSLGRLHEVLKSIPPKKIDRPSWNDQLNNVLLLVNKDDIKTIQKIKSLKLTADSLPQDSNHYGLIHYDYELDNIIYQDQKLVTIDFDDCCYHWYFGDILYALRDLLDKFIDEEKFNIFLSGYKEETNFDPNMLNYMDFMMDLHHVYQYGRLLRAVDIEVNDKHPKWMNDLIVKLDRVKNELYNGF